MTNLVVGIGFAHTLGVERLQSRLVSHGLRAIGQPSDALPHVMVRLLIGAAVTLLFVCVTPLGGDRLVLAMTDVRSLSRAGPIGVSLTPV